MSKEKEAQEKSPVSILSRALDQAAPMRLLNKIENDVDKMSARRIDIELLDLMMRQFEAMKIMLEILENMQKKGDD